MLAALASGGFLIAVLVSFRIGRRAGRRELAEQLRTDPEAREAFLERLARWHGARIVVDESAP